MRIALATVLLVGCGSIANKSPDAKVTIDSSIDGTTPDALTCATTPTGLGGRWRGEMNTNDEATPAHNGVTVGNSFSYVPGKHGMAFLFDGSTNVVSIDDADLLWPAASFSLEAWIKTSSQAGADIIEKYQCGNFCPANNANALYALSIGGGQVSFTIRADAVGGAGVTITDSLDALADGQWHHLVGVRDNLAKTGTIYVDGAAAVSSNLAAADLGPMSNLDGEVDAVTIGAGTVGGLATHSGFFSGAIDEVSYYASALTAAQITAIYNAPQGECP